MMHLNQTQIIHPHPRLAMAKVMAAFSYKKQVT